MRCALHRLALAAEAALVSTSGIAAVATARRSSTHQRRMNVSDHSISRKVARNAAKASPLANFVVPSDSLHIPQQTQLQSTDEAAANEFPSVFVADDAPVVYHRRLREGNFQNVSELLNAPYAPHPLKVLQDVLSAPAVNGDASNTLTFALTALHVKHVYKRVSREVSTAVDECRHLEDTQSQRHMREVMEQVESMQAFIEDHMVQWEGEGVFDASDVGGEHAVVAAIREQLKLTSELGMVDASVLNLQSIKKTLPSTAASSSSISPMDHDVLDLADVVQHEVTLATSSMPAKRSPFEDDVTAMRSCVRSQNFNVALALFRQMTTQAAIMNNHALCVDASMLSEAIQILADSVHNTDDFRILRAVLVDSDMSAIPVSVGLYSALIASSSRALSDPARLDFSLALYRRLRDAQLMPTPQTYASLMAVTASLGDPNQTFAFYREALAVAGNDTSSFPPALFTNLLLGYSNAGHFYDAKKTLEVLLEASAPMNRDAFHAVLAAAPSIRDAREVMAMMEAGVGGVTIEPTPTTYAHLLSAEGQKARGISSILEAFDIHKACRSTVEASSMGASLLTPQNEPFYTRALEDVCLGVALDPSQDTRVLKYLNPMTSFVQRDTTDYLGFAPQQPTVVPHRSVVVVLAADVLANVEEYVLPSAKFFSSLVIPYSSVAVLRRSAAKRGDFGAPDTKVSPFSPEDAGAEVFETRRSQIRQFLQQHHAITHIMSLDEEIALSGDVARYGIKISGDGALLARAAAVALNLGRGISTTKVYSDRQCHVVLATTKFAKCGRFVRDHQRKMKQSFGIDVSLWNPKFEPHWRDQGAVSATSILEDERRGSAQAGRTSSAQRDAGITMPNDASQITADNLMELLALE